MSLEKNKANARRFLVDIWSQGNMSVADEILDPKFVFRLGVPPYKLEGPEDFKQLVARNRGAFQGLTYVPDDEGVVAEGDKVVFRWTMSAKHVGTWAGYTASNKDVSIKGMTHYVFADGKILEAEVQNEALSLVRQVGGIPPAGAPEYKIVERNKATVRSYVDVLLNQMDFDRYDEFASQDFIGHRSSQAVRGREGLLRQMEMFSTAFPDINFKIEDMVAEGDEVVVHYSAPGTHDGTFAGIPPTGKRVVWRGIIIYRLASDRIAELWAYWNDAELVQQLRE